MISAVKMVLKRIVDWHSSMTAPMRNWRYGEDGKYVHIVLGVEALILFVAVALLLQQREFSFVGLSLYMVFDAFWMWFGGTAVAYIAYAVGFIKFGFYS